MHGIHSAGTDQPAVYCSDQLPRDAGAAVLDVVIGRLLANVPGVELPFTYTVLLGPLVVIWYILTEAGSIIENAGALGAPIPAWLTRMIAALESKVDDAGDAVSGKGK